MHKFIYISFLWLSVLSSAQAQEKKYVYRDSSLIQTEESVDTVVEQIKEAAAEEHSDVDLRAPEEIIDTSLQLNSLGIPADSIRDWRELKSFEYTKYLDSLLKEKQAQEKKKQKNDTDLGWLGRLFSSSLFKGFLWAVAIFFVLFIMYRLFLTQGVFRKGSTSLKFQTPQVEEEVITKESDFDAMIGQALRNDNYRLAVRYQYLKTLHKLAAKNLVEMAPDKTNYQYVREMAKPGLRDDFASLTLSYEYIWYGEFAIDKNIYQKIETDFSGFNRKL